MNSRYAALNFGLSRMSLPFRWLTTSRIFTRLAPLLGQQRTEAPRLLCHSPRDVHHKVCSDRTLVAPSDASSIDPALDSQCASERLTHSRRQCHSRTRCVRAYTPRSLSCRHPCMDRTRYHRARSSTAPGARLARLGTGMDDWSFPRDCF